MWRLLIGLLVTIAGWRAGMMAAQPYRRRWRATRQWMAFLEVLEGRIAGQALPLREILEEALASGRFPGLTSTLEAVLAMMSGNQGRLQDTMREALAQGATGLWEEERSVLLRMFSEFGTHNVEDERRQVQQARETLTRLERQLADQDLRRARLLELFGVITGVAAVIVVL